jgi:AAA domain
MAPLFYAALIEASRMQTGNGHEIWLVGGRTYTNFKEAVEAQDRRVTHFIRLGGVGEEELSRMPKRVIPEGATAQNYNPEPEWPISQAIDEVLGKKFRLFTGPQLNSGQHETRYLIPGVLAAGQLGGIFGPFKTLKTSLACDLMISLASGTPFLGRFPVTQPGRVLFLSGESGLPALKSMAQRICAERGLSLDTLENFVCSPDVPKLGDPFDMMAFTELVEREKPICVVIDPAWMALGGGRKGRGKSKSLFEMGQLLRPLAELCESIGCAVLVVHHCKQARKAGDPITLEDLAGSGFAELSAQWLLVSRRRAFDPVSGQHGPGQHGTGHHELWLTTGSRAGDQGLWELDVEEGVAGVEPTGEPPVFDALGAAKTPTPATRTRGWKTTVRPVTSTTTAADERFVAAREDCNLRRRALAFERQCQRLLELLTAYPDGRTARFIRDTLGMSGDRIKRVLDSLIEKGHVVKMEDRLIDARRPIITYARVQVVDLAASAIKAGGLPGPDQKVYDIGTGLFVDRKASQDASRITCLNVEEMRRTVALGLHRRRGAAAESSCEPSPATESGRDTGQESGRDTEPENIWIAAGI